MFRIIILILFHIIPNLCRVEPEFPKGMCGLFFRDRVERFPFTEAEKKAENRKEQSETEKRPWSVALLQYNERTANIRCGATLISPKYVLTAASCFIDEKTKLPNDMNDYSIVVGTNDPTNVTEGIERRLTRVVIHPQYEYPMAYFDMAIIEMEGKDLEFTMNIYPVCLPQEIPDDLDKWDGRLIDIAGFGSEQGKNVLDAEGMQGYSFKHCSRLHDPTSDKLTPPYQAKSVISMPVGFQESLSCARPSTRNYGLCPGDSGNTVGNEEEGRMIIVGVAQGILMECGNRFPSIYTRTDHNETLPWIWKEVFGEEFQTFRREQYDRYNFD